AVGDHRRGAIRTGRDVGAAHLVVLGPAHVAPAAGFTSLGYDHGGYSFFSRRAFSSARGASLGSTGFSPSSWVGPAPLPRAPPGHASEGPASETPGEAPSSEGSAELARAASERKPSRGGSIGNSKTMNSRMNPSRCR